MNKVMVCLILGILLIGSVALVIADNGQGNGNGAGQDECGEEGESMPVLTETECCEGLTLIPNKCNPDVDDCPVGSKGICTANCGNGVCNEDIESAYNCPEDCEDEDENGKGNQGLGQTIRNKVKAGVYTSETGEQIRVSELARNRTRLQANGVEAETDLEVEEETDNNKTKLKVKLSNGRNAEIKVMPDTASEKALERLRLKVCSAENNCTIELKEVPVRNEKHLAYEVQAERHSRVLGLFKAKMKVRAEVNAETGEVIRIGKPWWAFLATEPEE